MAQEGSGDQVTGGRRVRTVEVQVGRIPVDTRPGPPWWQVAPVLVHVDIQTRRLLVYRWPAPRGTTGRPMAAPETGAHCLRGQGCPKNS